MAVTMMIMKIIMTVMEEDTAEEEDVRVTLIFIHITRFTRFSQFIRSIHHTANVIHITVHTKVTNSKKTKTAKSIIDSAVLYIT